MPPHDLPSASRLTKRSRLNVSAFGWVISSGGRHAFLPLVSILAFTACHAENDKTRSEAPPVAVRVAEVTDKARTSNEEVVGTVRPKLRAVIEAKVSGKIEKLLVAPGQQVKAGDLLAQLDAREIQAKLDQALALRDQATRDLERARKLFEEKITTQAEFDAVQARERVAAGAATETQTALSYTKIVAPFDGVVARKLADVGDLAAPAKPIVEMEDPAALRFEADVPEALAREIKIGDTLPVRVSAVTTDLEGTVVEMAPVADPSSRTFLVKLDLPPAEGVRSGQFGRVLVPTGKTDAIWVPVSALIVRGQMETLFVAVNQHAQLRLVRTGKHTTTEVELLAGISRGEKVVIEGAAELHDGQPITVKP
jgi:RND family efflux transporter MFP subunit